MRKNAAHRITTIKPNGNASREVAPAKARRGTARNQDLPGMEDREIRELEEVALAYGEVRDQRMALNVEEASLKGTALQLMKKFGKTIYKHAGVEIRVIPGEEDVKVKVKKPGEDDDNDHVADDGSSDDVEMRSEADA